MTTPAEDQDDGWSVSSFGAPGGQLSKSATELDTDQPDIDDPLAGES